MDYKDRRTGLVLFGILEILIGLFAGLMALMMVVGLVAGSGTPGAPPMRMMAPIGMMYLGIGALFIALGVGSMMALRWARALTLVVSWWWLIIGVLTCFALIAMLPRMFDTLPAEQAAAKPFMIGCLSVIVGLFFILLPFGFILFYRSPNVKATVEARDPVHRWTDGVPLPLLAFSVWMILGAAATLLCGFMYPSFPIGRWMLRGAAVPAAMLAFALLMLFIGFGMLRRKPAAWWAAVGMFVLGAGWGVVLLNGMTNLAAWYREIGMATDPRQIEMMEKMYASPFFIGWIFVFWAAYLAFLIYLRRFIFTESTGVRT
jgi:hypothetical protein